MYALYLLVTLTAFLTASYIASRAVRHYYLRSVESSLTSHATLAAAAFLDKLESHDTVALERLCVELGRHASIRLTVIEPSGNVIADSIRDPASMDNHAHRPEVIAALRGNIGQSERFSNTADDLLMYVAAPLRSDDRVVAVARASLSLSEINVTLAQLQRRMAAAATVTGILAFLLIIAITRRIARPLNWVKTGAREFALGHLSHRVPAHDSEEIGSLAETMNAMAAQLSDRIETTIRQRNEQEAVLSSMVEAVVAVDRAERILHVNPAAATLFEQRMDSMRGRSVRETIRNADLQLAIENTLATNTPTETELHFWGATERILQVHSAPLRDASGMTFGVLIVMHDLTELRRLERVRRDFVANVSHELKTPLTSIKGFVETLQDGAIEHPDEARRFLGIMAKQVLRLQSILEDLLSLSRIEQQAEKQQIELKSEELLPTLRSAVQICEQRAQLKQIEVAIECPSSARARINAPLLEQAAVNLIENAIKYSDAGKSLRIVVSSTDDAWLIQFIDQGVGIEASHLPRLFERFYRVDKARSSKEGGTGLGLAIVKHIAAAHHGRVEVHSEPGQGSTFSIYLPIA
ncbi:MAG: ATP-binding protein [Kiritimatiellae bacterium]|nr:ATP-binding protein [Kiritimatiellia bacterium]MCO5061692.1 ATP-binding protein [Kiritimatiellia bacterium]